MENHFIVLILIAIWETGLPEDPCICDLATTDGVIPCLFEVDENYTLTSSSCTCLNSTFVMELNTTSGIISCYDPSPEVPNPCADWNTDGICDDELNLRCTATVLSSSQIKIVKYALYFLAFWIILWCVVTVIVNILHKNNGHQRIIHLFEEIAIALLAVVIFVLNTSFSSNQNICKFVAIFAHFFMVLINAAFLMESTFAKTMVHGNSKKNGSAFPVLNYILPVLIALIPTLVTYFVMKNHYALSGRFCFSTAPGDMFWAFVIPNWILIFLAGLQSQLSCLACDKTSATQDQQQCFWAKKSAKSLLMFALLLFTLWLLVLFAGNEQPDLKDDGEAAPVPDKKPPSPVPEPPAVPFVPESKDQPGRTESSYFYAWLTSSDRSKRASDILFRPKIA
ncbi:unnamed protein product [Haemonchus placei]|uniref:G_PROTEIN_RECEP_F2_4 domain-containing protein n=1 Tax=Haemonchus placei TaxID=6290 RepID=A0A0N4VTN2_HAEPC|nr:unnamed protein product [Haemonchus placei]